MPPPCQPLVGEIVSKSNSLNVNHIINTALCHINDWLKLNNVFLNAKESKYMIVHTANKNVESLELMIDSKTIDRIYEFNFLGL